MKTAVIFVQKNLIDLSKESFTLSKIINQTGKEFVRILSITGCFVFFCRRVKVFFFCSLYWTLCAHITKPTNKFSVPSSLYIGKAF